MNDVVQDSLNALRTLLTIPSVQADPEPGAPFGKENARALRFVLDLFEKEGFRTTNLQGYCGYAEVGEGELFGILGHLDVVPAEGNWRFPPFSATIADGALWGRGVLDDKGPILAAGYAVVRLLREGKHPKKRVRLIFGCNEESGWKCMEYYKAHAEMPALGFSPDADFPVIHCEKGVVYHSLSLPRPAYISAFEGGTRPNVVPDFAAIRLAPPLSDPNEEALRLQAQALLSSRFESRNDTFLSHGVSAHGSTPEEGVNAILPLLLSLPDSPLRRLGEALRFSNGSGVGLDVRDEKSGALSLNLGTVRTTEREIVFQVDIRFPVDFPLDCVTARLSESLPFARVTRGAIHHPLYIPKDHPLVKTLSEAYARILGIPAPEPIAIGGATYARVLPCGVAFGPIFPNEVSTIHKTDEHVSLLSFETASEIYYEAIKTLCF